MRILFLPYNKTILRINIIFSFALTAATSGLFLSKPSIHSPVFIVLFCFIVWLLSGGFFLAAYYFDITRRNEYYFYYNLGIGKLKLLLIAYCFQIVCILPLFCLLHYV